MSDNTSIRFCLFFLFFLASLQVHRHYPAFLLRRRVCMDVCRSRPHVPQAHWKEKHRFWTNDILLLLGLGWVELLGKLNFSLLSVVGIRSNGWDTLKWNIPTLKPHCLFLPVDRLEHGWAGQLEHGCWQAFPRMLEQTVHGLLNEQTWTTLLEPSW